MKKASRLLALLMMLCLVLSLGGTAFADTCTVRVFSGAQGTVGGGTVKTYTVDRGELGKTTVFAVKEDDYVISATVTNTLPDALEEVMTFTFDYDVEGFEKPDLSSYTSVNDEALG